MTIRLSVIILHVAYLGRNTRTSNKMGRNYLHKELLGSVPLDNAGLTRNIVL